MLTNQQPGGGGGFCIKGVKDSFVSRVLFSLCLLIVWSFWGSNGVRWMSMKHHSSFSKISTFEWRRWNEKQKDFICGCVIRTIRFYCPSTSGSENSREEPDCKKLLPQLIHSFIRGKSHKTVKLKPLSTDGSNSLLSTVWCWFKNQSCWYPPSELCKLLCRLEFPQRPKGGGSDSLFY